MKFFGTLVFIFVLLSKRSSQIECTVTSYAVLTEHPGGFNINIYLDTANASSSTPHPVLIFFPGFGNTVPSSIYSQLLTKFVEETGDGVILIALDQQENIDPNETAKNIITFFDYISNPADANQLFISWYPNVTLDIANRVAVFASGAGTQPVAIYLNQQCGPVKLLILIDATDGLYQLYDGQATTPLVNRYLPFQTPTFLIQSGLANTANSVVETITGPCSPNKIGGDSFYQVFSQSPNAPISYNIKLTSLT